MLQTVSLLNGVVTALTGMLIYDDLRVDIAYHRDLTRIGGIADHTSAPYKLVRYLREQGITRTAAMLGIDRGTLYNKLRRYGIERLE